MRLIAIGMIRGSSVTKRIGRLTALKSTPTLGEAVTTIKEKARSG